MFRRGAGNGNSPLPTDPAPAFYPDAAKTARSSGAGRQNRPACGGRSVERYLRNGFSRILVWVPARAKPAPSAGRALYGTADAGAHDFSVPSRLALASLVVAAEPERPRPLRPHAAPHHSPAASAFCLSSLSFAAHGRHHLRQEPDAGNPLVRIRGGGHEQS